MKKQAEEEATLEQKRVSYRFGRGCNIPARQKRLLSWLGWGILLSLAVLLMTYQVQLASQQPTDFCQDYAAANRFIQGTPIYLPLRLWAGYGDCSVLLTYDAHPPPSVLFFLPLALLPRAAASLVWGICCLAAYLGSGLLLLKEAGWRSLKGLALFVIASACWLPFLFSEQLLNMGQLLTLLLVLAWLLERRGHQNWAGGLLGLASLLKIWPVVLLLEALIWKRWRLALIGGLTALCGVALSFIVLGPGTYAAYAGPVQQNETTFVPTDANISLAGMVSRLFTGIVPLLPPLIPGVQPPAAILLGEGVAAALLIGVLAIIWWGRQIEGETAQLLSQGMLVTTLLLVFPVSWYWMLIALLLPYTTTLLALRKLARPPRWWYVLLILGVLPTLGPGWAALRFGWDLTLSHAGGPAGWEALLFDISTLGLLVFIGAQSWLLWWARQQQRGLPVVAKISAETSQEERADDEHTV
ncbi:MAG TPA: glycosyltransferase family 87 protein [Ktedonobacterales bacterium]|jgi:hypothetical protein